MDVFDLLKMDHANVKKLFHELEETTPRAAKKREELFLKIRNELEMHSEAEERLFYPRFKSQDETRELILEAYEEHKVVKRLLGELAAQEKTSEEWGAKAKVLRETVEHHVKEEEGELFKKCKRLLDFGEAESLAVEIEEFKEDMLAEIKSRR